MIIEELTKWFCNLSKISINIVLGVKESKTDTILLLIWMIKAIQMYFSTGKEVNKTCIVHITMRVL